ncbi:AhpC/TSA antioxidant enzyme-domain-containing protein [Lactarius quietus]|nr:AhpC/TSA antioxidant enzyme-domain-containing protein [Lactarius quietus]
MSASQSSPAIDARALEAATAIQVFNSKGEKVRFGDVFANQKTIVVFVRHFFCGVRRRQYVTQLATVRHDALEEASTKLVVVGCGNWPLIESYQKNTGFKGEFYANPDRKLYDTLGLVSNLHATPKGEVRRSYLTRSLLSGTLRSIWRGPLKNPSHLGKQGNISQNGGDFVFGPGSSCSYSSRMRHTEDHVEVPELMKAAGVSYP